MNDWIDAIGEPMYPLGHPALKRVFRPEVSKRIEDDGLVALLRQVHKGKPFKSGLCYSNVERIIINCVNNGWRNVLPYAGWLIIGGQAPIHHAWAVHQDQVIDLGSPRIPKEVLLSMDEQVNSLEVQRYEEAKAAAKTLHDPEAVAAFMREEAIRFGIERRKLMNEVCRPYEEGDIIENRVWGLLPHNFVYVGCPCVPDEARRIFNQWHPKYGKQGDHAGPGQLTVSQMLERGMESEAREKLGGSR